MVTLILTAAFGCGTIHADDEKGTGGFVGAGLQISDFSLTPQPDSPTSRFSNAGYVYEGGMTMGNQSGVQGSLEGGASHATNILESKTYMETGTVSYFGFKGGVFYGPLALGGGYRTNSLTVKSLSLSPSSYLESKYSGWTPLGFANFSVDVRRHYRGTLEAQYVTGTLKSSDLGSSAKFGEMSLSVRFFLLFD